jgi:cytochrome c biogenesis protein CcmG/thiol:disulfide interchange protein DsbE
VPCVEEVPALNEFTRKVAGAGVVVLGISADRNPAAYQKFLKANHVEFDTALDRDEEISSSYGTFKFPETYIIDRLGKVYEKFPGVGEWTDALVQRVKSL